jgi:hypothetical protein
VYKNKAFIGLAKHFLNLLLSCRHYKHSCRASQFLNTFCKEVFNDPPPPILYIILGQFFSWIIAADYCVKDELKVFSSHKKGFEGVQKGLRSNCSMFEYSDSIFRYRFDLTIWSVDTKCRFKVLQRFRIAIVLLECSPHPVSGALVEDGDDLF